MAAKAKKKKRPRKPASRPRPKARKAPRVRKAKKKAAARPKTARSTAAVAVERAAPPSLGEVRERVVTKLAAVVQRSPSSLRDEDRLFEDLGMSSQLRSAMARPYTDIARSFDGSPITIDEAESLETVGESVSLVHERSGGVA